MAGPRSPSVQRLQYAAARAVAESMQKLPLPVAACIGRCLMGTLHFLDHRHPRRCQEAIRDSVGVDQATAQELTRATYRHLGISLAELVRLPLLDRGRIEAWIEWDGVDSRIEDLSGEGKGLIFVSGHIGNWEVCGAALSLKGYMDGAVARPLDNPYIDAYVKHLRRAAGQAIWDKEGALRRVVRTLRRGGGVGMLVDQNGGPHGVPTTFFGRPCMTWPSVADLAMRTGAPMLPIGLHRISPMQFRMKMRDPIRVDVEDVHDREVRQNLLQQCNDALESIIREAPEQWLWLHRRWKTQPPEASSPVLQLP